MRNDLGFIWVGLKPNDKCPSKRKAEGELRQEKEEKTHTSKRRRGKGSRDWSGAATSQGMQTATRSWKKQKVKYQKKTTKTDFPFEPPEGAHLVFRFLPSRTLKEQISAIGSYRICGHLLRQP